MVEVAARIGPYELVRRLGRGGMAETFLARRRGPGGFVQECCVKRVLPEFADDEAFRDQFIDEATIHGRLQHGNIVRVQDFGEHAGTYFLVMERVDGCDLAQLLDEARRRGEALPLGLAITIAADLCQALAYAHTLHDDQGALELVHRDLTPSNVLLTRAGEVKLCDFGIARAAQRRHRTQTGYTKGKFCYMSPEQIEAAVDLDGRSDLFALGCVLYEMLAGARPFDAPSGNDLAVLPRILQGNFEPLDRREPGLPAPLVSLVHALLRCDRDLRPADAQAVLQVLAPLAPPVTVRAQLAAWVASISEAPPPRDPEAQAVTEAVDLEGQTRAAYFGEPTEPLAASPERVPTAQATRTPELRSAGPSRRALTTLAVSLGVLALVVLGFVLRPSRPGPESSAAGSPDVAALPADSRAEPTTGAPAPPELPAAPAPTPELVEAPEGQPPSAPPESEDRAPTGEVDLRVVVVPYGNIWIDGKRRGSTRVRATLPAGRHRIGTGRGDAPSRTEEVVLGPGTRTLEYALDGAFE